MSKNKKVIILLGRSGSGKGTQAKLLQEKFNLYYIGSGDLLRRRFKRNDFTGSKLKETLNKGGFAPTAVIAKLWFDRWEYLKNEPKFNGFIVDGSPRKILEAYLIDQTLEWYEWEKFAKILFIDISRREALNRLTKRRICVKCARLIPYIGEFKNLKKCDKCDGKLKNRADDTPKAINGRLDSFEKEVMPVINYYKKQRKLIRINGEQSIEDVFEDIIKYIK